MSPYETLAVRLFECCISIKRNVVASGLAWMYDKIRELSIRHVRPVKPASSHLYDLPFRSKSGHAHLRWCTVLAAREGGLEVHCR